MIAKGRSRLRASSLRLRRRDDAQTRRPAGVYATVAVSLVVAVAVGLAAFGGFARASFEVGPASVSVTATPSLRPGTTAVVPPFGSISARTHVSPLSLRIALNEVDLPELERFAAAGIPDEETLDGMVADIRSGFGRAAGKGLLAAALAAGFVGWALRHRWRMIVASALVGVAVPAVLVGITGLGLDLNAFRTPEFRGAVSYAPSLIELVQRRAQDVESLQDQVAKLARDLSRYYAAPQSFASGGALDDTFRVLHVSDLHLDPVGLELTRDLAREFQVSLVLDTGDINHYGSTLEAAVVASEVPTDPPSVFVPGNHDSPDVVEALRGLEGVTVLENRAVTIEGFRVFGVPDPSSERADVEPDRKLMSETAQRIADELRVALESGEPTPTILAIHNPLMARPFQGLAPLVVAGHTHTPKIERRGESWFLNSGTTGGIDFNSLRADPHVPHGASVLYYTSTEPRRLIAVDQIEVFGIEGQSSLKRTVIDESLLP